LHDGEAVAENSAGDWSTTVTARKEKEDQNGRH
jgi:hypothetical protein